MTHPLIQRLFEDYGYPEVTLKNHDEFAAPDEVGVLFFTGDPKRYKETTDVAVVLPELVAAFRGGLRPAVVAREDEIEVQFGGKTVFSHAKVDNPGSQWLNIDVDLAPQKGRQAILAVCVRFLRGGEQTNIFWKSLELLY